MPSHRLAVLLLAATTLVPLSAHAQPARPAAPSKLTRELRELAGSGATAPLPVRAYFNAALAPGGLAALEAVGLHLVPGTVELRGSVAPADLAAVAADPRVLLVVRDHAAGLTPAQLRKRPDLDTWFLLGQPLPPGENADHDGDPHTATVEVVWRRAPTRRELRALRARGLTASGRRAFTGELTRVELARLLADPRVVRVRAIGAASFMTAAIG